MCRGYDVSADYLSIVIQRMAYGLMGIVLPAAVGIFMLANEIVLLFYDDSAYLMSARVLRITIWTLLFSSLTGIIGQAFWASRRELLALRISVVNTIVQAALCVSLIHAFGIIGAAYSLLATSAFNFLQHLIPATKLFSAARVSIGMWRPIVASLLMALAVQTFSGLSLPQTIALGASVYAIAFVGLLATSADGVSQFRYVYDRMFTT
jgi:O-antigen/teichoic acid export membrane protein